MNSLVDEQRMVWLNEAEPLDHQGALDDSGRDEHLAGGSSGSLASSRRALAAWRFRPTNGPVEGSRNA